MRRALVLLSLLSGLATAQAPTREAYRRAFACPDVTAGV